MRTMNTGPTIKTVKMRATIERETSDGGTETVLHVEGGAETVIAALRATISPTRYITAPDQEPTCGARRYEPRNDPDRPPDPPPATCDLPAGHDGDHRGLSIAGKRRVSWAA